MKSLGLDQLTCQGFDLGLTRPSAPMRMIQIGGFTVFVKVPLLYTSCVREGGRGRQKMTSVHEGDS